MWATGRNGVTIRIKLHQKQLQRKNHTENKTVIPLTYITAIQNKVICLSYIDNFHTGFKLRDQLAPIRRQSSKSVLVQDQYINPKRCSGQVFFIVTAAKSSDLANILSQNRKWQEVFLKLSFKQLNVTYWEPG
jgi:hypothetical protein